jgi:hypothetical protein
MLYIQLKDGLPTGNPILHDNLLRVLPAGIVQPGRIPTPDDILSYGFTTYRTTLRPEVDDPFKVVEQGIPELGEDKVARQVWTVRDMTNEEREKTILIRVSHNRRDRTVVFKSTEWYLQRHAEELALNISTTLTTQQYTELLQYRQALRDMDLATDPYNVAWPTLPQWMTASE